MKNERHVAGELSTLLQEHEHSVAGELSIILQENEHHVAGEMIIVLQDKYAPCCKRNEHHVAREVSTLETTEVIIIKLGMASAMIMHRVLIILTVTFIQGNTDLNHENNKCSNISETVQASPIKFAVKSDELALYSRSQVRIKLDKYLTCTILPILG